MLLRSRCGSACRSLAAWMPWVGFAAQLPSQSRQPVEAPRQCLRQSLPGWRARRLGVTQSRCPLHRAGSWRPCSYQHCRVRATAAALLSSRRAAGAAQAAANAAAGAAAAALCCAAWPGGRARRVHCAIHNGRQAGQPDGEPRHGRRGFSVRAAEAGAEGAAAAADAAAAAASFVRAAGNQDRSGLALSPFASSA